VDDLFVIRGRGVVVTTDRTYATLDPGTKLKIGQTIEFRRDGAAPSRATVAGIEHLDPWTPHHPFAFLIGDAIEPGLIGVGSEVWRID
jgi:hypothetical protein